jgi:hypothetical protein
MQTNTTAIFIALAVACGVGIYIGYKIAESEKPTPEPFWRKLTLAVAGGAASGAAGVLTAKRLAHV